MTTDPLLLIGVLMLGMSLGALLMKIRYMNAFPPITREQRKYDEGVIGEHEVLNSALIRTANRREGGLSWFAENTGA